MPRIKYLLSATALFAALSLGTLLPRPVNATPSNNEDKITICHRTNSVKNPYIEITVDYSAVDGQGNNDHSHHTGPVATSEQVAQDLKNNKQKWGDIIPPVDGVTDGLNWDNNGIAIYENGCAYEEQETPPTEVVPAVVTFIAPTCNTKGSYTIPSTENVDYMIDGQVVAAGTYTADNGSTVTVTAEAADSFYISDETTDTWSNTFTAPTNCGHVLGGATQVQAPKGGVGAGMGGASTMTSWASALGVIGSLGSIGYGIRRFVKL